MSIRAILSLREPSRRTSKHRRLRPRAGLTEGNETVTIPLLADEPPTSSQPAVSSKRQASAGSALRPAPTRPALSRLSSMKGLS